MEESYLGYEGHNDGAADLPEFGDSYAEKTEDFGSPVPTPPVKKERRYSGMEIPFGVIESGSNVNEFNPMIRGDSKRMSMLRPEHQHEDVPFGVSDRLSTVGDFNPMRKDSGKFSAMQASTKPFANDDIPFGTDEKAPGTPSQTNPMRLSGKFSRTSSTSPTSMKQSKWTLWSYLIVVCFTNNSPLPLFGETDAAQTQALGSEASTSTTSNTSREQHHQQKQQQHSSTVATDISSVINVIILFVYMLCEIVYELAMDAIKPNTATAKR